jgi:hypothetical protein
VQDPEEPTVVSPLEALAERIGEAWNTSDAARYPECRAELEAIRSQPGADQSAVHALATVLAAVESEADLQQDAAGPQVETQYQELIQQVTRAREMLEHSTIPAAVKLTYIMEMKYRLRLMQSLSQRDPAAAAEQLRRVAELGKHLKPAEEGEAEAFDELQQLLKGVNKFSSGVVAGMDGDPAACEVAVHDGLGHLQLVASTEESGDIPEMVASLSAIASGVVAAAWGISRGWAGQFTGAIDKFKEAEQALEHSPPAPPPIQALVSALTSLVRAGRAMIEAEKSVSLGQLAEGANHYRRAAVAYREAQAAFPATFDPQGTFRKRLLRSSEQTLTRSRTLYMAQAALWPRWSAFVHAVLFVVLWLAATVALVCVSDALDVGIPWWGAALASLIASAVALRFLPIREAVLLWRRGPDHQAPAGTELDTSGPGR